MKHVIRISHRNTCCKSQNFHVCLFLTFAMNLDYCLKWVNSHNSNHERPVEILESKKVVHTKLP